MTYQICVQQSGALQGSGRVPGDKSISHRAVLFAALAEGESRIANFLDGGDCRATLQVLRDLGTSITTPDPTGLLVTGKGLDGFAPPRTVLDCGNSGTTIRLLAGMMAGQGFDSTLDGTPQLRRRPMGRIIEPLRQMGAQISTDNDRAPLRIKAHTRGDSGLSGIDYRLPVASAQLKSCLILAGLYGRGPTVLHQPGPARDHTERMLRAMGAKIQSTGNQLVVEPQSTPLRPITLTVPGDISSAAFLLVAASIVPDSAIRIKDVGLNPTRTGIIDALKKMGADIFLENLREQQGEPIGDIAVRHTELRGATFSGPEIVTMIDELPVLAVAGACASGRTVIGDAEELRVKETDRIATTASQLSLLGAAVTPRPDGMIVKGGTPLIGARVASLGDHRLAMLLAVAGLVAEGTTFIDDGQVTADSFPGFENCLASLGAELRINKDDCS